MRAESGDRKLAWLSPIEMLGLVFTRQFLSVNFSLQFHKSVQKRLWSWRTSWDVNIHGDITVDPFQDVITLLEWTTGNRARPHRDHVFRVGHLVVKTHYLRRHFFRHRPGDDHEIGLARRGPENFAAETREIVARRRRGDHLDRTTSQAELKRPDRITSAPIV